MSKRIKNPLYRVRAKIELSNGRRRNQTVGRFEKRQQARQFCRNNRVALQELKIIHPDGTIEGFG